VLFLKYYFNFIKILFICWFEFRIVMQGMENVEIVNIQKVKEFTTSVISKKIFINQVLFL